jgi:hypothetical protein
MSEVEIGDSFLPLADGTLDDQTFVLVEGPRGTAKTRSILSVLLCRALKYPGARILLARSTRTLLGKTVLTTLEEQVFPAFGMAVPGGKIDRGNRREYRLPNGSVFVPEGLDNISRSQSAEYRWIYPAELGEIEEQNDIVALAGSMRQDLPGAPPPQCIGDANPGAPRHWCNSLAQPAGDDLRAVNTREDYARLLAFNRSTLPPSGRWKRIITCHKDNPGYWDHAAWDWTPLGRHYVKTTLEHLKGFLRERWLYGLWRAAEGSIFPEFDEAKHTIDPFEIEDWPVFMGWDPGVGHPTGMPWIAVSPNGCLYVVDESYRGGWSVKQHCDEIKAREAARPIPYNLIRRYGDPQHAFNSTAQSIPTIAEQAAEEGIILEPWPRTMNNANELQMIEAVRTLICAGRLKVFKPCVNTINELQAWSWKKHADGSRPDGDDVPEDRNNDLMDPLKGMVAAGIHDKRPRYVASAAPHSPAAAAQQEQAWQADDGARMRHRTRPSRAARTAVGGE